MKVFRHFKTGEQEQSTKVVLQKEIFLNPHARGFHLITNHILNLIPEINGIVHVFIKHTSASLTINENADPSVRADFETHFNKIVSENEYKFFDNPEDLINAVDIVDIVTPTLSHFDIAKMAINAKKHVFTHALLHVFRPAF